MATTVDSLAINIQANSLSASNGINKLSASLEKLKKSLGGFGALTSLESALSSLDSKLGSIPSKLQSLSTALSSMGKVKISSTIAKGLSGIGAAAASIQGVDFSGIERLATAIAPLEQVGKTNIGSIFNQLKKLPEVFTALQGVDMNAFGDSIQQLTTALTPLATQMNTISAGFSRLPTQINSTSTAINSFTTATSSAGRSSTELLSSIKLISGAIKGIITPIAKCISIYNDYVEDVNLFTASLGEYASKAQEYAETISEAIGIDPGTWMENQGVFMTLTEGFGVASERAYTMSTQLTQLGYDLSSFFNISVGESMQKLQSGISGELEPLRRLGYDLSEARLQAIALSLGIDQSYNSMTQAEKAQLRYYAIMTQVTTAQGDMARTLESPANQIRVLKEQVTQAARAFGSIFIPMLNAVLTPLIAVAKAVRTVAAAIASLFGSTLPDVDYSGISDGADSVSSSIDSIGDSASGAGDSVKKLKSYLMGFDELNLIQDSDDSSGGGGGGSSIDTDSWDWDLPTYDFLSGLVGTKVDEISAKIQPLVDWITTHLKEILAVASAIGGELLAWKISTSLIPGLSSFSSSITGIGTAIAALATTVITITLTYVLDNAYLEEGKFGYLIANGLTTALGSAILAKVANNAKAGSGKYAAAALIAVSAGIDISCAIGDILDGGIDKENVFTLALGVLKAALAGYLVGGVKGAAIGLAASAAFVLSIASVGIAESEGAITWSAFGTGVAASGLIAAICAHFAPLVGLSALSGGLVGFGLALGIIFTIDTLEIAAKSEDEISYDEKKVEIAKGALIDGVAAAFIAVGLGATAGMAAGVGITVALGVAAVATIVSITASKGNALQQLIAWGSLKLSSAEIKEWIEGMLDFDVGATATVVSTTIDNYDTAMETLSTKIDEFKEDLGVIEVGVVLDDSDGTITALQEQLTGEDGIIAQFRETLTAGEDVVKLGLELVPPKDSEGNDLDAEGILNALGLADDAINSTVESMGNEIASLLAKGMSDGLTAEEEAMVSELTQWISKIQQAYETQMAASETESKFELTLAELDKESFDTAVQAYKDAYAEIEQVVTDAVVAEKAQMDSRKAALETIAQYYEEQGKEVPQSITDAIAEIDKQIESWDIETSIADKLNDEVEPIKALFMEWTESVIDWDALASNVLSNGDLFNILGNAESLDSMFYNDGQYTMEGSNGLVAFFSGQISSALKAALGEDYDIVMDVADIMGFTGWDLLGEDVQAKIFNTFSDAVGYDTAKAVLENLGYTIKENSHKLSNVLKDAYGDEANVILDITDILDVTGWDELSDDVKEDIFDILSSRIGEDAAIEEFNKLGYDISSFINDGMTDGITDGASEIADALEDAAETAAGDEGLQSTLDDAGETLGDTFVEGVTDEITSSDTVTEVSDAVSFAGLIIKDAADADTTVESAGETTGDHWTHGVIGEITNGSSDIQNAIETTTSSAVNNADIPGANIDISLAKSGWSTIKSWYKGLPEKVTASPAGSVAVGISKSGWTTIESWYNGLSSNTTALPSPSISVGLNHSNWSTIKKWYNNLSSTVTALPSPSIPVSLYKSGWNNLASWCGDGTNIKVGVTLQKNNSLSYSFSGSGRLAASGGFIQTGQMFIAREAGPEMVGSIGNRTAVANNDQIVQGITGGVREANGDVVNAINTLIQAVENKDTSVSIGDDEIGRANARYTRKRGVNVNSGVFANSY